MQKYWLVFVITALCCLIQVSFAQVLTRTFTPNFVLIAVVFFNLYRGLNYSLGAAFLGGFFLDSFGVNPPGINIFCLVVCAFMTGFLKKYIYQPGVAPSRVLMVFLAVSANCFLQYFVNIAMGMDVNFNEAFFYAIVPEIILTAVIASYTFERLKQCALKLLA